MHKIVLWGLQRPFLRRKGFVKGQIISSDFMVSVAVFLIILAFILPLFVRLDEERHERFEQDDLQLKIAFVTDYILKTTGVPEDWNTTNIVALGLANADGRVNATKVRRFMKLPDQQAKDLLGLSGVEFNLSFYSGYPLMTGVARSPAAYFFVNNRDMFPLVNRSGLVWDMYSAGALPQSDARLVYQGAKAALFNSLLANSSAYRTIIIEEPELLQSDVNINLLQNFVDRGGIIIYEGSANLISSGFSASSGTAADSGIVRDVSLIDAPLDSAVTFENPSWYFTGTSLNIWVEHSSIAGAASVGYWNHGVGEIYYVTDINGTVDGKPLSSALNLIGSRVEFSTGQMSNMVTSSRAVVLDSELNSMALAVMVVGK